MKTNTIEPQSFEFCFPELDTLVCVESQPEEVVIRATRATFSEERKASFIRELAAEGFIPDDYKWFYTDSRILGRPAVRWLVDYSWWKLSPVVAADTHRFMMRLLIGGILLWLLLMSCVVFGSEQRDLSKAPRPVTVNANHG